MFVYVYFVYKTRVCRLWWWSVTVWLRRGATLKFKHTTHTHRLTLTHKYERTYAIAENQILLIILHYIFLLLPNRSAYNHNNNNNNTGCELLLPPKLYSHIADISNVQQHKKAITMSKTRCQIHADKTTKSLRDTAAHAFHIICNWGFWGMVHGMRRKNV